jgi:hypothetical protein
MRLHNIKFCFLSITGNDNYSFNNGLHLKEGTIKDNIKPELKEELKILVIGP